MTYERAGGRGRPKSLVISDLRPLFLILYIHCVIYVNLLSYWYICILICLISICHFLICNSFISLLFISGSLFPFYFHTWFISPSFTRKQKNSPLFRVGSRSVMRTTITWGGGIYFRLRLENFRISVSLFETEKVDFATDSYSLRCWLYLRNLSTESTLSELPSCVTLTR